MSGCIDCGRDCQGARCKTCSVEHNAPVTSEHDDYECPECGGPTSGEGITCANCRRDRARADGGINNHLSEAPDFEFDEGQSFKLAYVEEPEEYWYVLARVWNYDADTDDALVQIRAYKQYLVGEVSTLGGNERLVTEDTLIQQYETVDKETASEVLHS